MSKLLCHCECTCIPNEVYIASQGFCAVFQVIFIIQWSGQILTMMFWIGPDLVKCKWFLQCLRLTHFFPWIAVLKPPLVYLIQLWLCLNLGSMNSKLYIMPELQSVFCRLNKSLSIVTSRGEFVLIWKLPAYFIILILRKPHYWWQDAFPPTERSFNVQLNPSVVKPYLNSLKFNHISQIHSEEVAVLGNADNFCNNQRLNIRRKSLFS